MLPLPIAIGLICLTAPIGWAIKQSVKRRESHLFQERESLDDPEIYRRFYGDSRLPEATVAELWHEIARTLRVPPEKIRPGDRFGKEIGVSWVTSEDVDRLSEIARARAAACGTPIDLQTVASVDEYIRAFSSPRPD